MPFVLETLVAPLAFQTRHHPPSAQKDPRIASIRVVEPILPFSFLATNRQTAARLLPVGERVSYVCALEVLKRTIPGWRSRWHKCNREWTRMDANAEKAPGL